MLPLATARNKRPSWLRAPWNVIKTERLSVPLTIAERIDPRDGCASEDAAGCPLIAQPGEYVFTVSRMPGQRVKVFSTGVPGESDFVTLVHSSEDGSLFEGGVERTPSGQWVLLKVRRQDLLMPEEKIEVVIERPKRKWLLPLLIGVGALAVVGVVIASDERR